MINYSISILSTYVKTSDSQFSNVLERVTWVYQAREGLHVAELFKDTLLPTPNPDNFVNFDNLTEEQIFDWVSQIEDIEALKEQVTEIFHKSKNSGTVEKSVPWANTPQYTGEEGYVIVNAGSVVYGPELWNSIAFNKALVPYGFDKPLPVDAIAYRQKIVPIDSPLDLGNQTQIYRLQLIEEPKYDSNFYKVSKVKWSFDTGVAVAEYLIQKLSTPEIQARLTTILKNQVDHLSRSVHIVILNDTSYEIYPNYEFANTIVSRIVTMSETDLANWYQGPEILKVNKDILSKLLVHVNNQIDVVQTFNSMKIKEINESRTFDELSKIILVP